jgi:protein-S-isoprenylcysteine O-methyltransferase Ste14
MAMGAWALSMVSSAAFGGLVLLAIALPRLGFGAFWPPPDRNGWQAQVFRWLFRIGVVSLIGLSLWLYWIMPATAPFSLQGTIMLGLGFGLAFRITRAMGWSKAFGGTGGLVTTGWFARSRNPIYVATWVGLCGWALMVPDVRVLLPLSLWALLYGLAPFWEEPWLRAQYGADYDAYAAEVPRFF